MKKYLALTLAVSFVACAGKDDNKSKEEAKLPTASYSVKKQSALTDSQKEEIKALMGRAQNMPKTYFFFDEPNLSEESVQRKKKEIAELTGVKKQIFQKIKADCEIKNPVRNENGKLDKVGDTQTVKTEASIVGNSCPIKHEQHDNSETVVHSTNLPDLKSEFEKTKDEKLFERISQSMSSKSKSKEVTSIVSEDLQSQTGLIAIRSEMSSEGTFTYSAAQTTGRFKANGAVKFATKVGPSVEMAVLVDAATLKDGDKDAYMEATFKFPSSNVLVQAFLTKKNGEKHYLNGELTTAEEINKLLGMKFAVD